MGHASSLGFVVILSSTLVAQEKARTIFLFVYDVWVELWGQSFADEQVIIERARTGSLANYDKLWTEALAIPASERARRFKQYVEEHWK